MRSLTCQKGSALTAILLAVLMGVTPTVAGAKPRPGKPNSGFRLLARSLAAITANRVYCGLNSSKGQVCVDSTGATVAGGGFWPKGTIDQYVFGSGIEVAGIIGDEANPEWRGNISGGFFEDPKGTTENGREVQPVFNSNDPQDAAAWPAAAFIPSPPDPSADLYAEALHGKLKAADADVWWMTWEGDPAANAGRDHPLGIAVETRGLAFNTPTGNEDVLYFLYTFYNITSANEADYTAHNIRPDMTKILVDLGKKYQSLNNAKFGITIPQGGYTIKDMFVTFAADMDVGDANLDYASVNVPFSLGFAYQHNFAQPSGWVFDPAIFGNPFFPGVGFVGAKYLRSPVDPLTGLEVGLTLYSNTSRETAFQDPNDVFQLYRYSTGNIDPSLGDDTCNVGDVHVTKICFINGFNGAGAPADMRFFQSSGPITLAPGAGGSVVVAYIFAPPVKTGTCPGPGACSVPGNSVNPGNPTRLNAIATAGNANIVDSLTGYNGFLGDLNANLKVDQEEIKVIPQSLLGKAQIAQTVFNNKFLQPAPPDAPQFFLLPGDNQVTVLWRLSGTEPGQGAGDPYFQAAIQPTLFDPNYRQFDVEGYRVYRGRTDSPNSLQLIAQFDYSGTTFTDVTGQVNTVAGDRTSDCAPEIGVFISCVDAGFVNGVRTIQPVIWPIASPLVQVPTGKYKLLAAVDTFAGKAFVEASDTAVTGSSVAKALGVTDASLLTLKDSGIPFVYVDKTVNNNIRYFYSVAAFDVNSIRSGPSSLESSRITKPVTPRHAASNLVAAGANGPATLVGAAGEVLDTAAALPTLDATDGRFSGPMPPANNWGNFHLSDIVTATSLLTAGGDLTARLDSIQLGSAWDGVATVYWYTAPATGDVFSIAITQDATDIPDSNTASFKALPPDSGLAARFDSTVTGNTFTLPGVLSQGLVGNYYTSAFERGCINGAVGFDEAGTALCSYNGSRWFNGPSPAQNETQPNPTAPGTQAVAAGPVPLTDYNNAGVLTGVTVIHQPHAYTTLANVYRQVEGVFGGAQRAADFNVYWGAAGAIDSVMDVTHKVPVPFSDHMGGGWGFLNQSATTVGASFDARAELTAADFGCVIPLKTYAQAQAIFPCTGGVTYPLSPTAVPGTIALFSGTSNPATGPFFEFAKTNPAAPQPGFGMYLAGNIFMFELPALPAAGTVWTMRSYIGAINGGRGNAAAGDQGDYAFTGMPRTLSALGVTVKGSFSVSNQVVAASDSGLKLVHTVPDPYYVTSPFETTTENKVIKFVNLPTDAIIRIYTLSGVLVRILEHHSVSFGGDEVWDVRNRSGQFVSSGVYFYHIEAGGARRVARMTVVNFAQ